MIELRSDLSFCFIEDRAVLLDLEADRYFLLAGEPCRVLLQAMSGRLDTRRQFQFPSLGSRPMFVSGPNGVRPVEAEKPAGSALETPGVSQLSLGVTSVVTAQYRSSITLKICGLRCTIAQWRALRPAFPRRTDINEAIALSRFFAAKRALVPLRRGCVPDSLALMRFLWRRGYDADLLFGVRLDPFAAHCWVQCLDQVLSDSLSNVADFTPVFRL